MRVQRQIRLGESVVVDATPDGSRYGVFFEDDGETGYLYGLDHAREEMPIVDAMMIYQISESSRGREISLEIVWNASNTGATLLADGYPQAVFDFDRSQACCRSGFPGPIRTGWGVPHEWDNELYWRINPDA